MEAILKTRMSDGLKTLIETNAEASGMNTSVYVRHVLKNAGVLVFSQKKDTEKELSLQERQELLLTKANQNGSLG